MKKIHRIAAILLSSVLLLAAGCAKPIDLPEKPTADMAAEPEEATESVLDDASLVSLRHIPIGDEKLARMKKIQN